MNRISAAMLGICLVLTPAVLAQETFVRVFTEPSGAPFKVDGMPYSKATTFVWPTGSKHVVEMNLVDYSSDTLHRTRWLFKGWMDNNSLVQVSQSAMHVITASPQVTSLKASVQVEHMVSLQLFQAGTVEGIPVHPSPVECGAPSQTLTPVFGPNTGTTMRPGVVNVNGACYNSDVNLWFQEGLELFLNAYPYEGFVFSGWVLNGGPQDTYLRKITVKEPFNLIPRFEPGKRVRIGTSPVGLNVLVDRTEVPTEDMGDKGVAIPVPGVFHWAAGSRHVLGAPTPQTDSSGKRWVFDSWDFGGGQGAVYVVDEKTNVSTVLMARFVAGATINLLTQPAGLNLNVDGRENWPSTNFIWGVGSKHKVTAPAEVRDSRGRRYVFRGWSNNGPATQELAVDDAVAANGLRLTATYELMNRLTVSAGQAGVRVQVDGADCALPCTVDRVAGTEVLLGAPASINLSEGARADFAGWNDGTRAEARKVLLDKDDLKLSFSYDTLFQLRTAAEPSDGGIVRVEPASSDGFYPVNQQLVLTAEARQGSRFRRWEMDVTGPMRIASLSLDAPKLVRAVFERTPFIATAGVRNGAAVTPEEAVSPGSIVSIVGASLANAYEVGPASPLAQAIGGVTVRVETRLLPLLFVSPEQINAQLPSGLVPGDYTLFVRVGMQSEVSAKFRVTRNAPGLFYKDADGKPFLMASHEDGTAVTQDKPARKGELITLFGTGFGPTERPVPDGFAIPSTPAFPLADQVEIVAGDRPLETAWAGAAPGFVGTHAAQFRVTEDLPAASSVELKVLVNGVASNAALLPLE